MKVRTNDDWLRDLNSTGGEQTAAIVDLRAYLLQAASYSLSQRHGDLTHLTSADLEQLAEDCAQEALSAILKQLSGFRGDSKFTTWAYRFAVNMALVAARHERRKPVSLDKLLDDTHWLERPFQDEYTAINPDRASAQTEIWVTLRETIERDLTDRQRQALKAIVFDEVPIDEVASYLGSNRNAVYKLLHDARRTLKARLEARGFAVPEIIELFSAKT